MSKGSSNTATHTRVTNTNDLCAVGQPVRAVEVRRICASMRLRSLR
jgi:hypothetical protein